MIKELWTLILGFCVVLCIAIGLFIICFTWYTKGQEAMVQELCSKKQYDFCQVVETTYKLKEFKND